VKLAIVQSRCRKRLSRDWSNARAIIHRYFMAVWVCGLIEHLNFWGTTMA